MKTKRKSPGGFAAATGSALDALLKKCDKLGQTTLARHYTGRWSCYICGHNAHEFEATPRRAVALALRKALATRKSQSAEHSNSPTQNS